jgi:CHAT domain-containing protein/Tfp pilus assembly protein PilF
MRDHSQFSNRNHPAKRRLGIVLVLQFVVCLPSCLRTRDPQVALDRATETFHRGEISKAAIEAEQAYRDFRGAGPEWAWRFTILRATILNWWGMSAQSLDLLLSEPNPPSSGDLAVRRHVLASSAYASSRNLGAAEAELASAERLCIQKLSAACSDLASARGTVKMKSGRYAEAQPEFQTALTSVRASGNSFAEATALLNLSWSADEQTHFDEALDWADSAQRIALAKGYADIAEATLGNIGWAYYKLGDLEKAEKTFSDARDQAIKLGYVGDQAKWLTTSAYIHMDTGDLRAAEQAFKQSLNLAQQINSREEVVNALMSLAFVSEQTNKLDDAQRYADAALKMAKAAGNGRDVVYPLLVEGRVAARRNDAATAEADFREVAKSADTPVFLKWEAERSLARLYEDENQTQADTEYRTALTTFEAARCGLHERVDSRLPFLSNAARIYEDYIHFLVSRGKTNDALRVADYARARTLAEGLGRTCKPSFTPDPLNAPEIARRAGGAILFYAQGQEHSYLWAITPREVRLFPLAANRSEIDAAVERYRKKIEGPPEILEASNDGSVLYQMLVAPAQDLLRREATRGNNSVFIIPDSGLNSLNFEALLPAPKHYWIEDATIMNAASLRLLPASHGHGANLNGKLLLIGNPVAPEAAADNAYPELPNAAAQMQNIEKYFPARQEQVYSRNQASPDSYLNQHPEQFSYIHFVAHGTASRISPLDSAIILSRGRETSAAAAQDDSFKLYARDIIGTHRLRAELVTNSACYSTGNRTYSGEGLVGLSWAFLRAGAHNVVAALWDVSDASAPQLVDTFYGELKRGRSPGTALRTAKLSLLHSADFRSPFYWAPFQLYTGS